MIFTKAIPLKYFHETLKTKLGATLIDIAEHLSKSEGEINVMCVLDDDVLVGVGFYSTSRIYHVYIGETHRGDGFGYGLVKAMLSEMQTPFAMVDVDNLKAISSFAQWGFKPVSLSMFNYFDKKQTMVMLYDTNISRTVTRSGSKDVDVEKFLKDTPVIWNVLKM